MDAAPPPPPPPPSAPTTTTTTSTTVAAKTAEIQALLRFLAHDAKLPLQLAIPRVKPLQSGGLTSPAAIAAAQLSTLTLIFSDEKEAKQVHNAAKRASSSTKKRTSSASSDALTSPSSKRPRPSSSSSTLSPLSSADLEASLALPTPPFLSSPSSSPSSPSSLAQTLATLSSINLNTNRAPLLLAFATVCLKHTHPHQPLSSRLSLAQALVSLNSRSKAASLGILSQSARGVEDEGWVKGQPTVKVLGRDVPVMRRWEEDHHHDDESTSEVVEKREVPLWGLDLEALRESKSPLAARAGEGRGGLIHRPEAARAYLLRAFATAEDEEDGEEDGEEETKRKTKTKTKTKKKNSASALAAEKEGNLACLLAALDLLFDSWMPPGSDPGKVTKAADDDDDETDNAPRPPPPPPPPPPPLPVSSTPPPPPPPPPPAAAAVAAVVAVAFHGLAPHELDRRAWSWYVALRPDVAGGVQGWGGKGVVRLREVLALRRV